MILVEAFTQRTLEPDQPYETSPLLADVPPPFANAVRRCLNPNPDSRPTAAELRTQFESVRPEPPAQDDDRRQAHPLLLAIPAAFLVLFAALIGPSTSDESQADLQSAAAVPEPEPTPPPTPARTRAPAAVPAPASTSSAPVAKPAASKPKPPGSISRTSTPVVDEVIPEVPRALRDKIQRRILVRMRVLVDPSGNVMAAMMESSGPNKNLANLADRAARDWKFVPAEREDTRVWILTFAFTREGVSARATAV
jgi:TonB family protein